MIKSKISRLFPVILFSFFSISLICSYAWAIEPIISKSQIVFPQSDQVINYTERKILYSDPEEANKKGEPVFTTEKAFLVNKWGRVLLIKEDHYYEDGTISISFYNYKGEMLNKTDPIFGDLSMHLMGKTDRVFLCQQSMHYCVNTGYIFDNNGDLINKLEQNGSAAKCGVSDDHKIIWTIHNHVKTYKGTYSNNSFKKLSPYSILKVYDRDGTLLQSIEVDQRRDVNVKYEDNDYYISVDPDFPG